MLHHTEILSFMPPSAIFILFIIVLHGAVAAVLSLYLLGLSEYYYINNTFS